MKNGDDGKTDIEKLIRNVAGEAILDRLLDELSQTGKDDIMLIDEALQQHRKHCDSPKCPLTKGGTFDPIFEAYRNYRAIIDPIISKLAEKSEAEDREEKERSDATRSKN